MKIKFLIISTLVFMMQVGVAFATILTSAQDTNITSGWGADSNFKYEQLTMDWTVSVQNSGLVQFNLSTFSVVTSATMNLYHWLNGENGADFGIYRNTSAWDVNTVTWNTSPSYDSTPASTLTISDDNLGRWRDVDIITLVRGWVDGTYANYGLRIQRIDLDIPVVYFSSSRSNPFNPEFAPFLDITGNGSAPVPEPVTEDSSTPVPEPTTMLLLGTGLAGLAAARRRKKSDSLFSKTDTPRQGRSIDSVFFILNNQQETIPTLDKIIHSV